MRTIKEAIKSPATILIFISFSLLLLSIGKSVYYTIHYGGTDLRCRIVGSRLLNTNESPYFFKWTYDKEQWYLDPNDKPDRIVNGNVVTPALLLLNKPLSVLSYPTIRIVWTILQYIFLILSVFLVINRNYPRKETTLSVIFIILGYACSSNWLLNIERGQTYILYAFIFSVIFYLYKKNNNYSQFSAGVLTGMAVWIRPLLFCISVPFLLIRNKRFVAGSLAGMAAGLLLFVIPFKQTWQDYFKAMHFYELTSLNSVPPVKGNHIKLPDVIENSNNITLYKTDFTTGGLENIQAYAMKLGVRLTATELTITFMVLACILAVVFIKKRKPDPEPEILLSFAFLLYILFELFIIGYRGQYNIIQWVPVVFLMVQKWQYDRIKMLLLITAVMFSNGFPFVFPFQYGIGEVILIALLCRYIFYDDLYTLPGKLSSENT